MEIQKDLLPSKSISMYDMRPAEKSQDGNQTARPGLDGRKKSNMFNNRPLNEPNYMTESITQRLSTRGIEDYL